MSLPKILSLFLSGIILTVVGFVVTLVTAQSGTTINTTPHVISNITVTDISQTTVTIGWQTEEPATSRVDFYINNTFVDFFYKWDDYTTTHSMTVHGRLPGTTYHYRVSSGDPSHYDNLSRTAISDSPDQVFTTLPSSSSASSASASSTTTPHVISNVIVTDITQTSVTIRWQTAEPSDSYVGFYVNGTLSDFVDQYKDHTTAHSVTTYGLRPGTTYHYRIVSGDTGLYHDPIRTAISDSPDQIFTTLPSSSSASSAASSTATTTPHTASPTIIVPDSSPSQLTTPSVSTPIETPTASPPSSPATPPVVPNIQPITAPPVIRPAPSPMLQKAQTRSTVENVVKKLSPKEFKKEQQVFRRELRKFERVLLRKRDTAALDQVADLREELYDLDPDDSTAGETLVSLQEEFAELRLIVETATPVQQGKRRESASKKWRQK